MPHEAAPRLPPAVKYLLVALTAAAAGYVILASPVSDWWDQRGRVSETRAELAAIEADNQALRDRLDRNAEPAELELAARDQLGLVREGEESYTVVPPATAGLVLPNAWPFNRIAPGLEAAP
jgi:cell division protein FtsB